MSPWMDATWALVKIFGTVVGVMAIGVLVLVIFIDIWAKKATVGRFNCLFLEQKHLFSRLLKEDSGHVYLGRGENREQYLLDPGKQFWAHWPAGLPAALQVPVRAHFYVRYNPEPWDPEKLEALISSRSLRIISDEAMLKTTWKDVRDSAGARGGLAAGLPSWALALLLACTALSGIALYMIMGLQKNINALLAMFGG